jgi:hypothetical protein
VTPRPPDTDPPVPLRALVLSGNFLGRSGAGGAEALAAFTVDRAAAGSLKTWFGPALERIIAHDGTSHGRAEAMARLEEAVDRDIAALDRLIGAQLDAVLHAERLRRLEAVGGRCIGWSMGSPSVRG